MGNFSYIAQNTNEAIKNPWHKETICELQLVVKGEVVEKIRGVYNGYGAVDHRQPFKHSLKAINGDWIDITIASFDNMKKSNFSGDMWWSHSWDEIVCMHFGDYFDSGIAAYECNMTESVPYAAVRSEDDPDQGDVFEEWED